MKAIEIRKEIQEYILSELQTSIMRLGINAQLKLKVEKDYRGQEYLALESTKFQTQPVMFKECWLEGTISINEKDENEKGFFVYVRLEYRWKAFSGGYNGTDLGKAHFFVEKDLPENLSEENARYYVDKVNGIEI